MVGYVQALLKALKQNDRYDYYQEYENLFIFSISDAPEAFGGFDAPTLIDKNTGEFTSYIALENDEYAGWLDNIIAEGSIAERFEQERYSIRYSFEHRLIPDLLYKEGLGFMASIVGEKNVLNEIFKEMLERARLDNPYGDEAIKVEPFRIEDIIIANIIFPEPEEEPLCYEAYALFDTKQNRAGYYCLEKGGTLDDEPFLCGWSEDGVHLNYGNCSFNREELLLNIIKLFIGYEGEDKPSLTATFTPKNNNEEE